ncbi:hypothetical protein FRC02_005172 [Tulasnella sp. 418]|nr:hypothetical protein FRC02_005172 [Tulasnella sp. 418]
MSDRRLSVASLVHPDSTNSPASLVSPSSSESPPHSSLAKPSEKSLDSTGASSTHMSSSLKPLLENSGEIRKSSIIDTQDEDVLIAVRALGDMRGTGLVGDTPSFGGSGVKEPPSRYWEHSGGASFSSIQPTPSLSVASSSSSVASPSIRTRSVFDDIDREVDDDNDATMRSREGESAFVSRVSTLPLVNSALRAYESTKASSRVINYGAGLVESSVKTISKPVMNRLPVNQLDEFACRQLDRLGPRYGGRPSTEESPVRGETSRSRSASRGRTQDQGPRDSTDRSWSRAPRDSRSDDNDSEDGASQRQVQVANRSGWQTVLLEAGGIGAAVSEESMKRLKYCLQWLQYATSRIDQQILVLRQFLTSLDSAVADNPDMLVSVSAMRSLTDVKKDVVTTIRQVVDVVSKYAGGSLPEPARATVRGFILLLPERWASAMQQQEVGPSTTTGNGSSSGSPAAASSPSSSSISLDDAPRGTAPTAGAALQATRRVLTLATESLDMLRGVTGVCKESLDRAETWVERLRIVGIQRQREQAGQNGVSDTESEGWTPAPDSPGVNIQALSIEQTLYGSRRPSLSDSGEPTLAGSRRHLEEDESSGSGTETEGGEATSGSGRSSRRQRRRQRRRIASPSPASRGGMQVDA